MKALYIEDDPINRLVVKDMLGVVGIGYEEGVDGPDGIAKLEHDEFDIVLVDLRMPGIDGLEVTRRIRARSDAKATVPIVVITADTGTGIKQACFDAGAQDMLLKPVAMQPLIDTICFQVLESNPDTDMI
ncbi:response regulator [Novosphingobium flavum]|uniref:Response regulator n=1 Tax=Novosphingobium aerophilum TaxID=2839843 RepID=A0A7X1KB86_9SPHN|nr:response regulator [Novosphingobium aerophilum]MBC2661414.1 response regulator [Novosphingobium aerophilum]